MHNSEKHQHHHFQKKGKKKNIWENSFENIVDTTFRK